jgi:hypothetical protein
MLDVPTLFVMLVLTYGLLAASLWVGIGPGARQGSAGGPARWPSRP